MAKVQIETDLAAFLSWLDAADLADDAAFHAAVAGIVFHGVLLDEDGFFRRLREVYEIPRFTVRFWSKGYSLPIPGIRPMLLVEFRRVLAGLIGEDAERKARIKATAVHVEWSIPLPPTVRPPPK